MTVVAASDRTRKHRQKAGLVRVEVEVYHADDAIAVRRFAADRRRARKAGAAAAAPCPLGDVPNQPIEAVIAGLDDQALAIVHRFAAILAGSPAPALIARADRVAANLADSARHLNGRMSADANMEMSA